MNYCLKPKAKLLGYPATAERFGRCVQTIHNYKKDPEFPKPRYWRSQFMGFDADEIDAFIDALGQAPGGEH